MTVYLLIWPLIVLDVMFVIARAFLKEAGEDRREGRDLI